MDTNKLQQINQQFQNNRQAALKALMENPSDYVVGQADALGIPYEKAATLVAFGMAVAVRDLSLQALKKEAEGLEVKSE